MSSCADVLISFIPLGILSVLVAIGYYFAWTDFKPKPVDPAEEYSSKWIPSIHHGSHHRALTDAELGLHQVDDNLSSLPAERQRSIQMGKMIRQIAVDDPNAAAGVIKGWLSEG